MSTQNSPGIPNRVKTEHVRSPVRRKQINLDQIEVSIPDLSNANTENQPNIKVDVTNIHKPVAPKRSQSNTSFSSYAPRNISHGTLVPGSPSKYVASGTMAHSPRPSTSSTNTFTHVKSPDTISILSHSVGPGRLALGKAKQWFVETKTFFEDHGAHHIHMKSNNDRVSTDFRDHEPVLAEFLTGRSFQLQTDLEFYKKELKRVQMERDRLQVSSAQQTVIRPAYMSFYESQAYRNRERKLIDQNQALERHVQSAKQHILDQHQCKIQALSTESSVNLIRAHILESQLRYLGIQPITEHGTILTMDTVPDHWLEIDTRRKQVMNLAQGLDTEYAAWMVEAHASEAKLASLRSLITSALQSIKIAKKAPRTNNSQCTSSMLLQGLTDVLGKSEAAQSMVDEIRSSALMSMKQGNKDSGSLSSVPEPPPVDQSVLQRPEVDNQSMQNTTKHRQLPAVPTKKPLPETPTTPASDISSTALGLTRHGPSAPLRSQVNTSNERIHIQERIQAQNSNSTSPVHTADCTKKTIINSTYSDKQPPETNEVTKPTSAKALILEPDQSNELNTSFSDQPTYRLKNEMFHDDSGVIALDQDVMDLLACFD